MVIFEAKKVSVNENVWEILPQTSTLTHILFLHYCKLSQLLTGVALASIVFPKSHSECSPSKFVCNPQMHDGGVKIHRSMKGQTPVSAVA